MLSVITRNVVTTAYTSVTITELGSRGLLNTYTKFANVKPVMEFDVACSGGWRLIAIAHRKGKAEKMPISRPAGPSSR